MMQATANFYEAMPCLFHFRIFCLWSCPQSSPSLSASCNTWQYLFPCANTNKWRVKYGFFGSHLQVWYAGRGGLTSVLDWVARHEQQNIRHALTSECAGEEHLLLNLILHLLDKLSDSVYFTWSIDDWSQISCTKWPTEVCMLLCHWVPHYDADCSALWHCYWVYIAMV